MGKVFDMQRASGIAIASLASVLLVAFVSYGATTISTNINTGGTLDVTGATTLTSATLSTTLNVTGNSTFDTNTFFVDAANNRVGVLTITPSTALEVVGTASTTNLRVGGLNSANGNIAGMVFGTCVVNASAVTGTSTVVACTGATGVRANDNIFAQSASSTGLASGPLGPAGIFIVSASASTSGTIDLGLSNRLPAQSVTASGTIHFWAVR